MRQEDEDKEAQQHSFSPNLSLTNRLRKSSSKRNYKEFYKDQLDYKKSTDDKAEKYRTQRDKRDQEKATVPRPLKKSKEILRRAFN